jgi:hypothetical protein
MKCNENRHVDPLEPSVTAHAVLYLRPCGGEGELGGALHAEGFTVHFLRRTSMLRAACGTFAFQALIAAPGSGQALADLPARLLPRICLVLDDDPAAAPTSGGLRLAADTPPAEVIAHLRALLRRARGYPPQYRAGPLGIDVLRGRASLSGQPLSLRPRELRALALLAHHSRQAVSTAELAATLHPEGGNCASLVSTYIGRLRRLLGERFIETLPGVGYRLTPPEQVLP